MLANNETGVVQPVEEIARLAYAVGALFMTNATLAVGKRPIDMDKPTGPDALVDLLAFSAHKFYGPKGVGGLFVRQRRSARPAKVKLEALLHKRGLRSGTLNVRALWVWVNRQSWPDRK